MRRWAAAAMLGAGVGLLALPACGGKTDEAARAAGITPTDALAFFSVNLAPSVEQQRNLQSIIGQFPDAPQEIRGNFEDARDELLDSLSEEVGLDYATDVEPWLGNEVAVALLPPPEGESLLDAEVPPVVAMFETSDADDATAALQKAAAGGAFDAQFRVIEDFLVVSDGTDDAVASGNLDRVQATADAEGDGLAGDERFTSLVDDLAGDRLLLAWADGGALAEQVEEAGGLQGLPFGPLPGLSAGGAAAADLHAERSALVVRGVATADGEAGGGGEPALTAGLPADVIGALTLFDVGSGIRQALQFVAGLGGTDVQDAIRQFGIDIEQDVLSWMEGELVVVAGPVAGGRQVPDLALVVEPTDAGRAEAGVDKIVDLVERQGLPLQRQEIAGAEAYVFPVEVQEGIQPAMALFEDRFVLASNAQFLERLAQSSSPSLGGSDAYESVIGEGSRDGTSFQLVVRIDPIREAIEAAMDAGSREDYERQVKANVEPLDSFGVSARRDGDRHRFELRLTVS